MISRVKMMSKGIFILTYLAFLINILYPSPIASGGDLPSNPEVQIGAPQITSDGKDMVINAGNIDKTWIDWKGGFNIGVNNSVTNIGPAPSAVILHNDVSGAISNIQGVLNANCNIFLLNPNGILFSPTARVNVGGLVASTLMISKEDFLAGKYVLSQSDLANPGLIVNQGAITALNGVTLAGGAIRNAGTITADLGTINLLSGKEVTLNISGDGTIEAAVSKELLDNVYDQDGNKVNVGVDNVGEITANGGKVYIEVGAVQDVFNTLVNQEGIVKAGSMVEKGGKIYLVSDSEGVVQNTGTLDASAIEEGASGGEIEMRGAKVGQFGVAKADGLGEGDGGKINLYATDVVALSSGSLTTANAGTIGNGGEVIVYSPDTALFWPNAQIEAKGGALAGDGGFVEVSGKEHVEIYGSVDASASNGNIGEFLIDPYNVTISGAADANGSWGGGDPNIWTPSATGSNIQNTSITSNLSTASVTVQTVNAGGSEAGDITVNAAIDIDGGNGHTLTLEAENDIIMNAGISDSAPASVDAVNVVLTADSDSSGSGDVDINAAVNTYGGSFTSTGVAFDNTGGAITTSGGAVTLTHTGAVTIGAAIDTSGATGGSIGITGSSINLAVANALTTDAANITLNNAVTLGADTTVSTGAGVAGNVTFASTIDGAQALTVDAGTGNITISGATGGTTGLTALTLSGNDISIANIGTASTEGVTGDTTITASNQLTFTGTTYKANAQSYTAAAGNNFLVNAGAPTTFSSSNDTITFYTGTILLANGSDLSMNTDSGSGNIALGAISGTNSEDVTLDAGTGNVYVWGIGAGGHINTVTIDGAEIHLYDNITTSDSSGNDVTLTGAVKLERDITIDTDNTNADGNITFSGTASTISGVDDPRTLTLQAGSGNVTLGGAIGAGNLISTLTVTSTGTTTIGANITTINADVDFTGATNVVLGADVVIDTGAGAGDVLFSNSGANSLSGGFGLRVDAGTGNVTFDNATQLTSLAVNDGASGSGATAVTFNGTVDIPGSVEVIAGGDITVASGKSIQSGGAVELNASGTLTNNGTISGDSVALTGTSAINLNGNVNGNNGLVNFVNAVTLTGNSTVSSTNSSVTFSSTIDGAQNLTVNADNGTATFSGAVGGTTSLTGLTVSAGTISAGAITTTGAADTDGGNVSLTSKIGSITAGAITANGGAASADSAGKAAGSITLNSANDITVTTLSATGSAGNDATLDGAGQAGGAGGAVTLMANNDISLTSITTAGGAASSAGAGDNANGGAAGAIAITASGDTTLSGNLTSTGGNGAGTGNGGAGATMTLNTNLLFAEASALTFDSQNGTGGTPGADGDVILNGNLNGTAGGSLETWTVNAGAGTVTLNGNIGNVVAMGDIDINTTGTFNLGGDVTVTGAGSVLFDGAATTTLTKDVTINGAATSDAEVIKFATLNGSHTLTIAGGNADITLAGMTQLTGLTITGCDTIDFTAAVSIPGSISVTADETAADTIDVQNTIDSTGGSVTFSGPVELNAALSAGQNVTINGATTLATGAITITADNGDITLNGDVSGAFNLTLAAANGNVALSTVGGGADPTLLDVNSATASLNGATIAVAGNILFDGAGLTTLNTAVSMTSTGTSVNLGPLNGANSLTIAASNADGDVTLNDANISSLSITDANDVSFNGDFKTTGAASVTGSDGTITVASGKSIQAGGLVTLTTSGAGGIDINGPVTGDGGVAMTASGGNIAIDADVTTSGDSTITLTSSNNNVNIAQDADAAVTSVNGKIDIDAGTSVLLGSSTPYAGQLVTTGTGNIDIDGATDFTMAGTGTQVNSGGAVNIGTNTKFTTVTTAGLGITAVGNITLDASGQIDINAPVNSTQAGDIAMTTDTGDILLSDEVRTTTTGDVTLTATAGYIDDDDDTAEDEYVAGDVVTLTASGGIGANTSDIDTQANSLDASSTTAGNIVIDEYDSIVLTDVDTVNGSITVSADGQITATDVQASGAGQDVTLSTTTGGMILTLVTSDNDITATADAGDITIGQVGDAGTGNITITATTGAIDEIAPGDSEADIVGDAVTLTAEDGIGSSLGLETTITSLDASVTSVGNIVISDTDAITLTDVDTVDGDITISAGGLLTATDVDAGGNDGDVSLSTTAGGMILTSVLANDDITATASAGDITLGVVGDAGTDDVTITATTGSINEVAAEDAVADITADAVVLTAQDEIGGTTAFETEVTTISADSTSAGDIVFTELDSDNDGINLLSIDTNNGNITITTNGGTHEAGTETTITSVKSDTGVIGTHDISITASTGDITLAGNTSDTPNVQSDDDITLIATAGSITEDSTFAVQGDSYVDIVGDLLTITAQDEIGSSTGEFDIETTIATLDASSTSQGDIVITETDGITLSDVDTANGAITIVAGGQITATDVASLTDSDSNDISLTSTGSGIEAQLINAGTTAGDVTLDAQGGAITQDGDADADVIADVLTATAAGGIDLDTTVNSVSGTASAPGTITLDETNAITLTSLSTTDGAITVTSGGNMTVTSVTAGGDTGSNDDVTLTTTSGDIIMSGDITALNDEVTLTSAANITDTTDGTTDISAANLTITANSGAVGAAGANNELDTDVDTLTVAAQGPVYILEDDAIGLTSVVTTNGLIDIEAGGTITSTTVTAGGSNGVTLYATNGNIVDSGGAALLTAGATSYLKADNGIIGTIANHYNVDINGDLWILAGAEVDEVSAIIDGTVKSSGATERVEILQPTPPGLVIFNNHLMGGGNYGSGSIYGSILSRGYGVSVLTRSILADLYYARALEPWGYQLQTNWAVATGPFVANSFLQGPEVIIDGSQIGVNILPPQLLINPARFQPQNYYIIRRK